LGDEGVEEDDGVLEIGVGGLVIGLD